jgi:ribosomal protein S27E
MRLNLTDQKCKECGAKLTVFEVQEKNLLCLECYKETRMQALKIKCNS